MDLPDNGSEFDPKTARAGFVYLNTSPFSNGVRYVYVGQMPLKRNHGVSHCFQVMNRVRSAASHSGEEARQNMVFDLVTTRATLTHPDFTIRFHQGEKAMTETTTTKSVLAGSRTIDPNIAAIMREDTRTVDVKLNGVSENLTYVTDLNLELDDLVVLPNKAGTGYHVGVVTGVHDDLQIPPNSEIVFKWVVSKLDLTAYKASMERNATIEQAVSDAYQNNARRTVRAAVMAGMDDKAKRTLEAAISGSVALAAPKE